MASSLLMLAVLGPRGSRMAARCTSDRVNGERLIFENGFQVHGKFRFRGGRTALQVIHSDERATVYEGESTHGNQANLHDVSAEGKQEEANPHASSRILAWEADQVALRLLEAQAAWLAAHDRVSLRRMLLELLLWLEE